MHVTTSIPLLLGIASATSYGGNQRPLIQDPPQVEATFPDAGVKLYSPAFLLDSTVPLGFDNGTSGPTSQDVLEVFIRALAAKNPWAKYSPADYVSEEGRSFPYVLLSSGKSQPAFTFTPTGGNAKNVLSNGTQPTEKVRIWIQGGVHGDEPGGDQAVMALLGKMNANQTWTAKILQHADIMVLPRYNPDGVAYFQRIFASNADPNRDHTKLVRQQTRDIKRTFTTFAPHVAVDMHEYGAGNIYSGAFVPGADAMFSAAKNLNIHPAIRNLSETLFAPALLAGLESNGLRGEPYATGTSETQDRNSSIVLAEADTGAKIGRNAMGLTQAVTFLFETRGISLASQEFARRTTTGLTLLETIVQTSVDNVATVRQTIDGSIKDFIQSKEPIVITDAPQNGVIRNWTMVNYASGQLTQVPVYFFSTTPAQANLTRARPEAYIIPRGFRYVAERVAAAGLVVDTLPSAFRGTVEALTIQAQAFREPAYFEGAVLSTVTTNSTLKDIQLPAGSFLVSTRQKNAGLAFAMLEPENTDSLVSFGIVPLEAGDEYPIFRILS